MTDRLHNRAIAAVVCNGWAVPMVELLGRSRCQRMAEPRQVAYWLGVRIVGHRPGQIADFYRRDRTTILHGLGIVDSRLPRDQAFAARVRTAIAGIAAAALRIGPVETVAWPRPASAAATFQSFEVLR